VSEPQSPLARRHLLFGWGALLVFLVIGSVLEAMHGFKVAWYLDVDVETRRLVWRLGHAHGTLFSIVNILFGLTVAQLAPAADARWAKIASPALIAGTLLLPAGFFTGGLIVYGGDPGMGIFLVPLGAAALGIGVLATVLGVSRR